MNVCLGEDELFVSAELERRGAEQQVSEHEAGDDEFRECGAERGPDDAETCARNGDLCGCDREAPAREDEHCIEDHVEKAHDDVQDAREFHVPAGLDHAGRDPVELKNGQRERKDEEIPPRVRNDRLASSEPMRQRTADERADREHRDAEDKRREQSEADEVSGFFFFFCADRLRDLDGETDVYSHAQAAEKPGARGDKADRSGGFGAEMPDHRGIDVLHDNRGYLRKDCRQAQRDREDEQLFERQGVAVS